MPADDTIILRPALVATLNIEALLAPLEADAPCGADLEYDAAFLALQEAGTGKPEQQWGDTVIPAQEPDWLEVHKLAVDLAERTRDLRIAVWLTRSGARLSGLGGAVEGLQLLHGLVERYWEQVHPLLDASDNNDPTARLSALSPLVGDDDGLADLRAASLTGRRGSLTVRDVELAFGPSDPRPGESVPSEDGVVQGISAATAQVADLTTQMTSAAAAVQGVASALETHLEPGQSIEMSALKKVVQRLAEAAQRATVVTGGDAGVAAVGDSSGAAARSPGTIESREDAVRALERVCAWIERNEPSHPAPLLIRRAERLMSMNFIDIIRDIAPDSLSQIERLAGSEASS